MAIIQRKAVILFGLLIISNGVFGQRMSIKTNLIHAAALTPNLTADVALGTKTTFDLYTAYNWFNFNNNRKFKHWMIQPGMNWWLCEPYNGSFWGIHVHGGEFNVGNVGPFTALKNNRYEGWFAGAGFSYGYQWLLSDRWSFELELGLGYAHMIYDKFGCEECAEQIGSGHYNYFGPTKIQASFVLFIW